MAKTTMKQPVEKGCARVPVVMQQEALECGAASLTMILAYYGKWIPLEQARTDCGVSRDGATAKQILLAAENHGLKVTAYRYEPEALRRQGKFPCVIHWNFNHFAVLCGFRGDKAVLNDPAKGNITLSMEQFDEGFTGVCLQFEPTENFVPSGKPRSVTRYAIRRLRGAGAALTFVVLTTVIVSLIGIITPGFSRFFIDRLLQGENGEWLVPFLCALAGLTAIQLAVEWIRAIYSRRMDAKLSAIGSATFMWHVLRMPMDFFSQRFAGDIQGRMQSNATIANQLVNTFAPLLLNTVMMVFYLAVMLRYSVMLSLVGIVSILVNVCLSQLISQKRVNITRVQKRDAGKLASTTVSGIEMIESIKASGAENGFFERWSGFQASVNAQSMKYAQLQNLLGVAPQLVSSLCNAVVLILGVFLVMNGRFTEGMLMNFQAILSSFAAPTQMLIGAGQTLQELRTDMERIEDVMNYPSAVPEEQPAREDVSYRKLSGRVELKNVTFGYSKLRAPLIENFSLSLQPGSRVALVGASGCGKSTLARLISGLYQPWSGEILFDGKPISEIDRSVFTGSLAVVDQDVTLFEDSVANNIKMFDRSIEDFEMIVAARDARIHEDIMRRPEGYRYPVAEGGKDFSGGQRQRMEIARVLAQDPTIVVLDEATSALDAKTEYEVMNSVKKRDVTCVVVAHRLSTIRDCDEIIVLDHGRVVERGTHAELYAQGGLYTRLVTNE